MNKSSSHTGTIVIVIVIVLAIVGYFYVQGSNSSSTSSSGLVADQQGGDVGLAEVNLLNQIQNIKIDTALFQNPAYLSLVDHTVAIPAQAVGRPNPFAPIPGVGNPNAVVTGK